MSKAKQLPKNRVQKMMSKAMRGVAPQEHDNKQDKALIVAYLNGDEEAGMVLAESFLDFFSVIMNKPAKAPRKAKASQKLWSEPNFHDYEDLFQEILVQFFIMVKQYDPDSAPFAGYVGSMLHQRVFDRYFSEFIRKNANEELEFDDSLMIEMKELTVDESKLPAEYIHLYQALNKLSSKQREAVEMSVVRGWNSTEIAQELEMKPQTVRKNLERGLKRLRELLNEEE